MDARLFRVILPVSDIDRAARFYAAVFEHDGVRVSGGRHYFSCGSVTLACYDANADGDATAFSPNPEWLYFEVADLHATLARVRSAGGTLVAGDVHGDPAGQIARRPWGEVSFYAMDPFGNRICFVEKGTAFTG
jgi:predicted enzyme related to lactoylglutathione lyase